MKKGSIIIVDDNKNVLNTLRILLSNYFEKVHILPSPQSLMVTIKEEKPDIALLDMNYSAGINTGNEGFFWLSEIKKVNPEMPVILFTAYADIDLAVRALKEGATDFIVKPWDNAKLIATLQSAYALCESRKEVKKLKEKQDILNTVINKEQDVCWGESVLMQELYAMIQKVAKTDANVLITGENGTGKEVVARAIHKSSARNKETMVAVDMGAITPSLFESELFGHIKGSFTDAHADRAGKFEAADKGTLFLDEIANLDLSLQAKLLTALQSRTIVRVGSNQPLKVDIRLICATNADLHKEVANGSFREDLFYRINTIHLEVPPLRKRPEDIPLLATFFLDKLKKKYDKKNSTISEEALKKLKAYSWPGNVRELRHAIEKAIILSDSTSLKADDFFLNEKDHTKIASKPMTIEEMEKEMIQKALKKFESNLSAVSEELGISRPTLYSKIKKYGL